MPSPVPVRTTEHAPPLSVQLVLVGVTLPLAAMLTVPVGVVGVPADVSITVTVHVLVALGAIGLSQTTAVDVVRLFTVIVALPTLVACVASP